MFPRRTPPANKPAGAPGSEWAVSEPCRRISSPPLELLLPESLERSSRAAKLELGSRHRASFDLLTESVGRREAESRRNGRKRCRWLRFRLLIFFQQRRRLCPPFLCERVQHCIDGQQLAAADLPSEIRNGGGNDPERLPFRKRRRSSGRALRAAPSASLSGKGSSAPSDKMYTSLFIYSFPPIVVWQARIFTKFTQFKISWR